MPFVRTEPTDQEEHNADAQVRKDDADPNVIAKRRHEAEDACYFLWI